MYTKLDLEIAYMIIEKINKMNDIKLSLILIRDIKDIEIFSEFSKIKNKHNIVKAYPATKDKYIKFKKYNIIIATDDIDPAYVSILNIIKDNKIFLIQPGILGNQDFTIRNIVMFLNFFKHGKRIFKEYKNFYLYLRYHGISIFKIVFKILNDIYSRFRYGATRWGKLKQNQNVFVSGILDKKRLIRNGINIKNIHIVGQPRFDKIIIHSKIFDERLENHKKYIKMKGTKFLYLPNAQFQHGLCSEKNYIKMHKNIISHVLSDEDNSLIIKPHPEEDIEYYEKEIEEKYKERTLVIKDVNLYRLINKCDIIITGISTAAMESLILHKRLLVVFILKDMYMKNSNYVPYIKQGVGYGILNDNDYAEKIHNIKYDNNIINNQQNSIDIFLKYYLYKNDGKSTDRIIEYLRKLNYED